MNNISYPKKCPHCEKDYKTNCVNKYPSITVVNSDEYTLEKCIFCGNIIFIHSKHGYINKIYPSKININIPNEIAETSPKFIHIYEQCLSALSSRLELIVGPGLHKAIEQLITDYLIQIQNEDEKIVLRKSTFGRINMLDKNIYAGSSAHLVRVFGNDETHYENLYRVSVDDACEQIEILCDLMASRIKSIKAANRYKELENAQSKY